MTCPQCHTQLSEVAAFCFRCGAPISQPFTFTYLPAGAPPWPTAQAALAYLANTSDKPMQPLPQPTAFALRFFRTASHLLALLGLFLLALTLGAGLTLGLLWANGSLSRLNPRTIPRVPAVLGVTATSVTGTATPTTIPPNQAPTPTSFQALAIPELSIQLQYPTAWTKDALQVSSSSSLLSVHPQQNLDIFIALERYSTAASASFSSTTAVNQANLTSITTLQNLRNMQIIQSNTTQLTIGGALWDERDATFINSSGILLHATSLAVQHNNLYYAILFFAPDSSYNAALQAYFQPMFNSFQFQNN